jgi:hypothetical protein
MIVGMVIPDMGGKRRPRAPALAGWPRCPDHIRRAVVPALAIGVGRDWTVSKIEHPTLPNWGMLEPWPENRKF